VEIEYDPEKKRIMSLRKADKDEREIYNLYRP
jgi:uncharacterized DUF497 family protein